MGDFAQKMVLSHSGWWIVGTIVLQYKKLHFWKWPKSIQIDQSVFVNHFLVDHFCKNINNYILQKKKKKKKSKNKT